jgi:nicotinamidase-related amidase
MHDRCALLSMDFQKAVVGMYAKDSELLNRVASVQQQGRHAGMQMIHVVMGYRKGIPEISARHPSFEAIRHITETDQLDFHDAVAPQFGEAVVTKRRIGAFSGTDLDIILRAQEISHLILLGIATSGVVLSTLLQAVDLSYQIVVLEDCCMDLDQDVHACLTRKVFPAAPLTSVLHSSEFSNFLKST